MASKLASTKHKQQDLFKELHSKYDNKHGGKYFRTRKGRSRPRPLSTQASMHLVLRSTKATGLWSFLHKNNQAKVRAILQKFSQKYAVKILSFANVGNHLHLQIKIANRFAYKAFIRATTSAIAMSVTGWSRWTKTIDGERFWTERPFTQIVTSFKYSLNLRDYIEINKIEGFGILKKAARMMFEKGFRVLDSG
jgi:REP element-mobilizing transposase RayT